MISPGGRDVRFGESPVKDETHRSGSVPAGGSGTETIASEYIGASKQS